MERKTKDKKKDQARKIFLIALGIGIAGGAAYLAWDYYKRKRNNAQLPDNTGDTVINITNTMPASSSKASGSGDSFPLKRGSKGPRVLQLQQALARIIGTEAMNANGGADGIFGAGTANALKLAGYGEVIDESTFVKIVNQKSTSVQSTFNAQELAASLYRNARAADLAGTLAILNQIGSTDQYAQVNEYYKKQGFVSRTMVTDLLEFAFKYNEPAKQQIRTELLRMGLKMDSAGKWSLEGLGMFKDLITLRETVVIDALNNRIPVRRNTILGDEVKIANGMTWFRAVDNSLLQVPTQDVKYS